MCSRICEAAKCAHIINQTSKHVTMRRSWLCEIICVCRQLYYGVLTCHTCSRLFRRLSRWRAVITSIQNNFFIVGTIIIYLCFSFMYKLLQPQPCLTLYGTQPKRWSYQNKAKSLYCLAWLSGAHSKNLSQVFQV